MTFRELKKLVEQGEGARLEFKRKAAHPDKIMKEVVAFANTDGGTLVIGVDDNGTIPGVSALEEEEFVLEKAIEKYCYPAIAYSIERVVLSDRAGVLLFHILPGTEKPYAVRNNLQEEGGKAYVRVRDRSVQASREVRQILRQQKKDKSFRFGFGDKEKALMQYLDLHQSITLSQFAQVAAIPRSIASRTLVLLTLAGVLRIVPDEGEDHYRLT
ncbi:helix-turn-helix domain-containing protein [Catalinimonas alkaloidigena]|uniref:AlbA family DNA-binding domain-containing protein n=1 Tax=Catalinimonas alkaloidigena TaxID=1075417 RepID=UPI000B7CDDF6|nr:ATP-binding protein [Catalinimonas alkaloidigena]